MNLKQARYFKVVAQYGTITAAAKNLYISQPSLSQTLRQMEEEAGVALFDRSTTPFRLTYAGEKYLKAAEIMLDVDERLKVEMESIRNERGGRLRLGISVTRATQILPDILPVFIKEYPKVAIELIENPSGNLEDMLEKGKVDLALAATEATDEGNINYELIEKEKIGIIAGQDSHLVRRLPAGTPITLEDVVGERFVCLDTSHSSRRVQDKLFSNHDFHPDILLETGTLEVGRRIALTTGSCMLLPDVYADGYVTYLGGGFYPLRDYVNKRHFYACYRKEDNVKPYMRAFIMIVTAVLNSRAGRKEKELVNP